MQPYFMPYIGYFQLISAVDQFVVLDDVNYIKKGWINRNRILLNGKPHLITLPVAGASQNQLIKNIKRITDAKDVKKKLDMIYHAYGKAPNFEQVFQLIKGILDNQETYLSLFIVHSLKKITEYLDINTRFLVSSRLNKSDQVKGAEKILAVCKAVDTDHYVNPIGGVNLYHASLFQEHGIELSFIRTDEIEYRQFDNDFIPNLSILDVLMFNSQQECRLFLNKYSLLEN